MTIEEAKKITLSLIDTFNKASLVALDLRKAGLKNEIKSDNTPVSNGDIEVNKILMKKIEEITPNIKIISEEKSRALKPNYYLVLPWHFKKEILKREAKIRKSGTKFIFPLPKLSIN